MISSKSAIEIDPKKITRDIIAKALSKGNSISLWKHPASLEKHLIVSESAHTISNVNLEESDPGFLFAPFSKESHKIFIPAEHYYLIGVGSLESFHFKNDSTNEQDIPDELIFFRSNETKIEAETFISEQRDYRMLISDCVHHIRAGRFEKVVPSRKKIIEIPQGKELLDLFYKLCEEYPFAMVSLVSTPFSGTWIGATPEPLITIDDKGIFKTVALAGTQPYQETVSDSQVSWKQKEIEEQAFVQRYIINCFKKIRLREFNETGPRTVRAGNLLHLRTDFTVDLNEVRFPDLGTVMLNLLHPTSAVCGLPQEPALDYLIRHEGYQREYYSGYLGPVGVQNQTHLYVNLRCMKWEGTHGWLYAGAGVTADSNPDAEFHETELKMQTLLRLIHSK